MGEQAIVMTWRLWSALLNAPATSPLFRRIYVYGRRLVGGINQDVLSLQVQNRIETHGVISTFIRGLITVGGCLGIATGGIFLIPIAIFAFLFSGAIYGLRCATATSACIVEEREKHSYDLLSTAPFGQFGINWSVATGYLFRYENFDVLRRIIMRLALVISAAAIIVPIALILLASDATRMVDADRINGVLFAAIVVATIGIGIYLDFVQSVVTGTLIGILTPVYARNKVDTQIYAVMTFLSITISTYTTILLLAIGIIPQIYQFLQINNVLVYMLTPGMLLLFLYGVRELTIRMLWRMILHELNAGQTDVVVSTRVTI